MNNEIKEILENIKTKYNDYYVQDIVSGKDLKILLDYINHLERINEKLKSYLKLTDEEAKEYMYDTNKEIDRLNNIIDELEKDLEDKIYSIEPKGIHINYNCEYDSEEDYIKGMKEQSRLCTLKESLDKLKELKEGK